MSNEDHYKAAVNLTNDAKNCIKSIIYDGLVRPNFPILSLVGGEVVFSDDFLNCVEEQRAKIRAFSRVNRCAIVGEKDKWAYATICAAFSEGVTFCIVDPQLPNARRDDIISDFRPQILARGELFERLAFQTNEIDETDINDTAYVMFTSGSTGRPKGVKISYTNFLTFLDGALEVIDLKRGDRWANHANLSFDLSLFDLLGSLKVGATLFPIKDGTDKLFPGRFIERNKITVWHSTPTTVRYMIAERAGPAGRLKTLRSILMCGEALRSEWVNYLLGNCDSDASVYNCYGPTETTVFCTVDRFSQIGDPRLDGVYAPLGTQIEGVVIGYEPLSDDEFEIVVRGGTVGQGYEDEDKIQKSGYGRDRHGRYFRTGDIVELRSDAAYFKRRIDRQVKIGGNRFELEDAEAVLSGSGCLDCVVGVHNDSILLFVGTGCECSDERLREICCVHLPDFAQPRSIIRVAEWPISSNGKLDYKELLEIAANES